MFPHATVMRVFFGIVFLRSHFADDTRVTDVSPFFEEGVVIPDHLEGVCSLYLLFLHTLVSLSNALAQATELVCIGDNPRVFIFWMASQLAEF